MCQRPAGTSAAGETAFTLLHITSLIIQTGVQMCHIDNIYIYIVDHSFEYNTFYNTFKLLFVILEFNNPIPQFQG